MIDSILSISTEQTRATASRFAKSLKRNEVVALFGEFGVGKTQFVKGVCNAFNVHKPATSPSFTILKRYDGKDINGEEILIYHFDLYRINYIEELLDIGYEEFIKNNGICLIEWAEKMKELLPANRYDVYLSYSDNENVRKIEIEKIDLQ